MFQFQFNRRVLPVVLLMVIGVGWLRGPVTPTVVFAQQGKPASDKNGWASQALATQFDQVLKLIKPQAGESRWMEIEWQTSLWTAREMAAKQGKPIFVWYGSGGSPACHT
jgi:hypothetical protein